MKKSKNFQSVILFVLALSLGGGVFAQGIMDRLPIGNNWAKPNLDDFLMQHVIYARDTLSICTGGGGTPTNGIVGTNVFTNGRGCGLSSPSGASNDLTLQSGEAHIQKNNGRLTRLNTPENIVYFGGEGNAIINNSTPKNPVYPDGYPRLPQFPLSALPTNQTEATALGIQYFRATTASPWGCPTNNLLVNNATWPAGVYYIDGDLVINNDARLQIAPVGESYRTIIYVKGNFFMRTNSSFVPQGFVSVNDYPEAAKGQIVVIALSDRCDDCMGATYTHCAMAAIHLSSPTHGVVGSFIAPYGSIYTQYNAGISGQLLAERIRFISEPSSAGFIFVPPVTSSITAAVKNETFDRTQRCNKQLTNHNIAVSLSEPLSGDVTIELGYKITLNDNLKIEDDVVFPAPTTPAALTGVLRFSGKTDNGYHNQNAVIPFNIVNNETYKSGNFTVELNLISISGGNAEEWDLSNENISGGTITINMINQAQRPMFNFVQKLDGIIEYHNNGAGTLKASQGQVVATLSASESVEYEISGVNKEWFEIVEGELRTSEKYRANYDSPEQNRTATVTVTAINNAYATAGLECFAKSEPVDITVNILPWNDNPFELAPNNDVRVLLDISTGIRNILINVGWLLNLTYFIDLDLTIDGNIQKILGLTNENLLPNAKFNTSDALTNELKAQQIQTEFGEVTIEDGQVRYKIREDKIANLTDVNIDEFYYTALDTAVYGYPTDTWVMSVKVTVIISAIPLPPLPIGSIYYDSDGNGIVDSVVVVFDDEVEDLNEIEFTMLSFAGVSDYLPSIIGYGSNGDGTENKTTVILALNFPKTENVQDSTNGVMRMSVTYLDGKYIPLNPDGEYFSKNFEVNDGAAPVVVSAMIITSNVLGENDVLVVKLSENFDINVDNDNIPFKFMNMKAAGKPLYDVQFDSFTMNGNECRIVVKSDYSGKISLGDSIFINSGADHIIKDVPHNNEQTAKNNKKVEILQEVVAQIFSAAYFETNDISNGYVNLIKVDMRTKIDLTFAEMLADAIVLSPSRDFTKDEVILNSTQTGFDLKVTESAANNDRNDNPPRTGINSNDVIVLPGEIVYNNITIKPNPTPVPIDDSIAPVILKGIYNIGADTTLDVVFSEPITASMGNPYKFWHVLSAPEGEFDMTFSPEMPKQIGNNTLRYKVTSTTVPYPLTNDSIWIVSSGYVKDDSDNMQNLTVRAPLKVNGDYSTDLNVRVVPQPLYMVKVGDKRYEPKSFDPSLVEYYKIQDNDKGVAVVIEAKGPISSPSNLQGYMKILDQTGNAVTQDIKIEPSVITEGDRKGNVVGVAVWDGKNTSGRNAGAGTYLALIQVEVQFDDREGKEVRTYRKIIAVSVGKR
ncbi:MAG: hypothetical protein LBH98_05580 [Chitinispirillales bacterium]|jgi:hypothetical protein|nr:hypothetical protein [Chitinispirillales bacterium]